MNEFFQGLKQRKLVQWTVAYVAAAFALRQGIGGRPCYLRHDPILANLRADPRWAVLVHKMGFTE